MIRGNSDGRGALAQHRLLIHNAGVPLTLGACLTQSMNRRGHTYAEAADALGASPMEIEQWAGDLQVPGTRDFDRLMVYLEVDLEVFRGLILRSQMLRAQRHIHGIPESA